MKILFINKHDARGGAAIAAWQLQETLYEKYLTENQVLCGIKHSDRDFVQATRKKGMENFLERSVNFGFNQLDLQYFWFPFSTRRILQYTKKFQPDIISLHNLHGGFFKTTLLQELAQTTPLVWTLHDMWAFTANGAYTGGDTSWKDLKSGKGERKQFPSIGLNTGEYLLKRKKRIYDNSRLTLVCPSEWMQNQARQSPLFSDKAILHIPNGVNLNRFHPADGIEKCKRHLGIESDQKVLLLFAEKISAARKGGATLVQILQKLDQPEYKNVTLLTIGRGTLHMSFNYLKIKTLGYLSDEKALVSALQAADLFIFPTLEDNLPNTLVEAIACGLPCVTYDVGGCGEIIQNGSNGMLAAAGRTDLFLQAIKQILNNPEMLVSMRIAAREKALAHFDVQQMADHYYVLFQHLLKAT